MGRIAVLAILLMFATAMPAWGWQEESLELEPAQIEELSAAAAILIEPVSGRVLYAANQYQTRAMASTTKLMTALVALELGDLNDVVTVTEDCTKIPGTSLYLEAGEQLRLSDLLYGLLLRSGNDAAMVIAKHIGGAVEHFVSMMNRRAWELGMLYTQFANPHGLDQAGHYTTAYDLALLGAEVLRQPQLREIAYTREISCRELTTGRVQIFTNSNKLLERDERAIGLKIGWTDDAGRCLVAAAREEGLELVAVVLAAPDLYTDVSKLFDYGFSVATARELISPGKVLRLQPVGNGRVRQVALTLAEPVAFPLLAGEEAVTYAIQLELPEKLEAPLAKGEKVGRALVVVDQRWVIAVDVVTMEAVNCRSGFWRRVTNWARGWWR